MVLYRHHKFALALLLSAAAWASLYFDVFELSVPFPIHQVIETLPLYVLIVLGCYALMSVGISIFSFNNCPEATAEVQQDILDAKAYLRPKGVSVDQ